jgi:hypothetical protein
MNNIRLLAAPAIIDRRAAIAILTHARQGLRPGTTIARIADEHWSRDGHRTVIHRGLGTPPPADVAIQHVDLTRVPRDYLDLASHYPRTINGAVADISKRRISSDLLSEDDDFAGPVMVKTDLNHAGMPERVLRRSLPRLCARLLGLLETRLPCSWFGHLPGDQYLVFERKDAVPRWVWRSKGLVVQPLHVERRGNLFAMHQWYFLGDRDCVSTFLSHAPVVKLATVVERLPLHTDVPDALRRRRAELKFDYGKFDYVAPDGQPILLDANRTPDEGPEFPTNLRVAAICAALAGGLATFLT